MLTCVSLLVIEAARGGGGGQGWGRGRSSTLVVGHALPAVRCRMGSRAHVLCFLQSHMMSAGPAICKY